MSRASGQAVGKCTQKRDLSIRRPAAAAAGSFGCSCTPRAQKGEREGDFYLGDKKKLFGEFAKSGLRRPCHADHPRHDKLFYVSHVSNDVQVGSNAKPQRNISQAGLVRIPNSLIKVSRNGTEEVNE